MENTNEKLREALNLTHKLLRENGITGVATKLNTNKTILGLCRSRNRVPFRIEYSRTLAEHLPLQDILDTVRHEVAHAIALVDEGASGHGPAWQRACRKVGLAPERTFKRASNGMTARELNKRVAAYMFVCEKHSQGCTFEMPFHRMTKQRQRDLHYGRCPKCKSSIKLV